MKDKTYRIIIAGDYLPNATNIPLFEAGDAQQLFGKEICHLFGEADFSIVNLEGALTDAVEQQEKIGPVLKAPISTVKGIKSLGVDAIALANNHIMDYGPKGYSDTIRCLETARIQHVGSGKDSNNVKTHISLTLGEKRVCIYNVSETFFNIPDEHTAGVNLYDEYIVCNELKELKQKHDYIIVIYHGGAEYLPYPTPMVRRRFHRMVDCGADFITAQHTHCIGCEEYYNGAYLLYGQGNFFFARQYTKKMTREGLVVEICIREKSVEIKKHKIFVTNQDLLRYAADQSLNDFEERSRQIDNEELICSEYERVKAADIMSKYLMAFKGNSIWNRMMLRLFPKRYKDYLLNTYTKRQILINQTVVNQDRRQEDMRFVWNYIVKKRYLSQK